MDVKLMLVELLALGMLTTIGCDSGCDVGETWCDGDVIILCVSDDADDYWEDDYDDTYAVCGYDQSETW